MPIDAVPITDLSISGMEITQGVQDPNNSVVLVKDKPTYVRVYPAATFNTEDVLLMLFGEREAVSLPGHP